MIRTHLFATILYCVSSCLLGSLATSEALAQVDDRADKLFVQGKAAARAKDWDQAHQLLSEAWQLKKSYDIASNLGQVAYLLGKHAEAAQHVAYALQHYPASGDAEQKQKTQSLFDLVRKEVSSLSLNVSHGEAEILIDGKSAGPAAALPPELFVEPGERTIVARLGGESALRELSARAGQHYRLELVLSPANTGTGPEASSDASQNPPTPSPPHRSEPGIDDQARQSDDFMLSPKTMALIAGGALTLASGVGLAVYTVKRADADSDLDVARHGSEQSSTGSSSCVDGQSQSRSQSQSCRDLAQAADDWESAGKGRNIFLGTTIGLGVATLATFLFWPSSSDASDTSDTSDSSTAHSIASPKLTPVFTPDQRGLLLTGSF